MKETMEERFDKKVETYDKDGGFRVYVEDYDNTDLDTELIKNFIRQEKQSLLLQIEEIVGQADNGELGEFGAGIDQERQRIRGRIDKLKDETPK